MAGYNPNSKLKYFDLSKELEGKREKEIFYMSQKILRMLANGRINLSEDGHYFLSESFVNTILKYTYSRIIELYWDVQAYNNLIKDFSEGKYSIDSSSHSTVLAIRNKKNQVYKAYNLAQECLVNLKFNKQLETLVNMAQRMREYKDFY